MLTGKNQIGNKKSGTGSKTFSAVEAQTGNKLPEIFYSATIDEVEEAVNLAKTAFASYSKTSQKQRAEFLNAIADEIMNLGDELIKRASLETALPEARFVGERGRTVNQLKMFANLLEEGSWTEASIDTAIPDREPVPKPDLRKMLFPLGPVVVFGASNFPLAFSTAGGDTASALAAGCPVIVKSHPAHPGTGELVSSAIIKAAEKTGMPEGVFSNLNDSGYEVGSALVKHPGIKAVGFTGSFRGGKALMDLVSQREEPVPVFAEMGSVNPVILLNNKLEKDFDQIGKMYAGSITLGVGQFCTNPGLLIGIKGEALNNFINSLADEIKNISPAVMLTNGIGENYISGLKEILEQKGVALESVSGNEDVIETKPVVASVPAKEFILNPKLHEEIFGPFSLVVKCGDKSELAEVVNKLSGQLTATVMAEENELSDYKEIVDELKVRVGRIIFNNVPTGVEVCSSMQHGGPFPASSDSRFTSVGTGAIKRFARPICFQDWPESLLPDELKNSNPLKINRLINNVMTKKEI